MWRLLAATTRRLAISNRQIASAFVVDPAKCSSYLLSLPCKIRLGHGFPPKTRSHTTCISYQTWSLQVSRVGGCKDSQNLGDAGPSTLEGRRGGLLVTCFSPPVSPCQIWSFQIKPYDRNDGAPPKNEPPASRLSRSRKVTATDTDRQATYDFILVHSNHERISFRFRDKRKFRSKIAIFSTPDVFRGQSRSPTIQHVRYGFILMCYINFVPKTHRSFYCATQICIARTCYGNVAGLARWLTGCPSYAGIVSKRLNLSEILFDHLKAPSFQFVMTLISVLIPTITNIVNLSLSALELSIPFLKNLQYLPSSRYLLWTVTSCQTIGQSLTCLFYLRLLNASSKFV